MNRQQVYDHINSRSSKYVQPQRYLMETLPKAYARIMAHTGQLNTKTLYDFLQPDTPRACLVCGKPLKFKTFELG